MTNSQPSRRARPNSLKAVELTPQVAAELLLKRREARTSLTAFTELLTEYQPARHHRILLDKLERLTKGEFDRLLICMPPGHGKSSYTSLVFPAWYMGLHPDHKILAASHTVKLSEDWSRKVKGIIGTEGYRRVFPGCSLSSETNSANRWETTEGGQYRAAGVGTGIAGFRADLVVVDDPYRSQEDADSRVIRDKIWQWWGTDMLTRLKPGGKVVLIQTRWNLADIAGMVLEESPDEWEQLVLPAFAKEDDPMGRAPGEALWPGWIDENALERIKSGPAMSSRSWSSLYQQEPVPEGGGILKAHWWELWQEEEYPPCDFVVAAVDTATSTKTTADFSACAVFGVFKDGPLSRLILLHAWQERLDLPDLCDRIERTGRQYQVDKFLIEGKSSGIEVVRELQRRSAKYSIQNINPTHDKIARAYAIQGVFESGCVYAPDRKWADLVITACAHFPAGAHDDMVDAVVHAVSYLRNVGVEMYADEQPDLEEEEWQRTEFQPLY
jgi:predicted phage terminase large subunit-like protein